MTTYRFYRDSSTGYHLLKRMSRTQLKAHNKKDPYHFCVVCIVGSEVPSKYRPRLRAGKSDAYRSCPDEVAWKILRGRRLM